MDWIDETPAPKPWRRSLIGFILSVSVIALALDVYRFYRRYSYYQSLAARITSADLGKTSPHEVIVVLTGDNGRIPRALELLRQRKSQRLIISGTAKGISLTDLANQQGNLARRIRDVWNKIDLESESSSTMENAIESEKLLKHYRADRAILVTSDYHMDRSLAVFINKIPRLPIRAYPVHSTKGTTLERWSKIVLEYWKNRGFRWLYARRINAISQPSNSIGSN